MKKYILSLVIVLGSFWGNAQKIVLTKGQHITIITQSTQDVDMMGMGMQMKNSSNSTSLLVVKDANKETYTTTYQLSKINLTVDMMGQQTSYDSEKPADKDSEMGKEVADKVGKEVIITVNKSTGKATLAIKEDVSPEKKEEASPLDGLMDSFGSAAEDATVETIFFLVPAEKKMGDNWIDSSSNNGMKEVKTYTIQSIEGNMIHIGIFSTMEGSKSIETEGMQMDISLSTKTEGEILVDAKSSLVKKRSSVMDLTGSIEMMGQSIPITSKVIMSITYQ
jgi:hypothetical protein